MKRTVLCGVIIAGCLAGARVAHAGPAAPAPGQSSSPPPAALAPGQTTPAAPAEEPTAETVPDAPSEQPQAAPKPEDPVAETTAAPTTTTASIASAPSAVDDAAWRAVQGRQVIVETRSGTVEGELAESAGDTLVLVLPDGRVKSLPKADATGVRVAKVSEPASAKEEMASLDPAEDETKAEPTEEEKEEEELSPGEQRRKERRENREHAILGAFTMQGATYSHWRGDGVNAGHASYAMDFGVGGNFSPKFGMYAMAGGLLGARIDDKSTKANYGHIAALFVFGGKYYYSTVGAGVAFSRLRFEDNRLQKDRGLAMPFKLVGKIPLPKKLYIGLGLTYEFAAVRGFSRFVNAIGGQIVFGRW